MRTKCKPTRHRNLPIMLRDRRRCMRMLEDLLQKYVKDRVFKLLVRKYGQTRRVVTREDVLKVV